jgi:aryl-alcohol dehydrogenase-like predicted oxidoreductase
VQVVELPYNILTPIEVDRQLRSAAARGIGLIGREPLLRGMMAPRPNGQGYLPGDHRALWPEEVHQYLVSVGAGLQAYRRSGQSLSDVGLRYALGSPYLSTVIVGCRTPEQVAQNLACARAFRPR